jgi:hypothetical protein
MFDKHQPSIYYRIIKGVFGLTIDAIERTKLFIKKIISFKIALNVQKRN